MPVLAAEFDLTVDDEIRKNYNPDKLEEDVGLPPLPKILDDENKPKAYTPTKIQNVSNRTYQAKITQPSKGNVNQNQTIHTAVAVTQPKVTPGNSIVIKKGTKIYAKLASNISDRSRRGVKVRFISTYPVTTRYFTIPSGTEFDGQVINSHRPQLTANGGLLVLNINSVVLNGEKQPIDARVIKVNSKKVFFNNIKGKRKYLSSSYKSTKNGQHFFTKMMRVTTNLAGDGSSIILTPFSLAAGIITLGGNILISPALGVFHKGSSLAIPSGSEFVFKLNQDAYIYN